MAGSEIDEGNARAYSRDPEVRRLLAEYREERALGAAAYDRGEIDEGWFALERADLLKRQLYALDYAVLDG
jgi:hypothetical protein